MPLQLLLINKPPGPSSHDIIDQLRKITGVKKIGHSGTLDPFAQGLLLIAVGRESTQKLSKFVGLDKEYMATLKLGAVSDSYDKTGTIKTFQPKDGPSLAEKSLKPLNRKNQNLRICSKSRLILPSRRKSGFRIQYPERFHLDSRFRGNDKIGKREGLKNIESVLKSFIGPQEQLPPMFSAKKINGKKLYELARKGIEIKRKPNKIKIYDIKLNKLLITNEKLRDNLVALHNYQLLITISCSSGTYIRSLASDIGQALGCGAYLEKLVRTKIGEFTMRHKGAWFHIKKAVEINQLTKDNWQNYLFY